MTGLVLAVVVIAINCGCAVAALRRPHAIPAGGARWLLASNLVVLAMTASFLAMRP